ncbi:DUF6314 family protein [Alphaproteobacteria bacterium]|jgi:hypothetical protein|nr:DUF6314 family protein [Alphaproteobacteria bacterium]
MNHNLHHVFLGRFRFKRSVSFPSLHYEGGGVFKIESSNISSYWEEGGYDLDGKNQTFYQKRYFEIHPSYLLILKEDQSVLHRFSLKEITKFPLKVSHTHVCAEDLYKCDLVVEGFDKFSMNYNVRGPSKS